jgi:hypothetical protein
MNDPSVEPARRDSMARAAAAYRHAQLQAIAHRHLDGQADRTKNCRFDPESASRAAQAVDRRTATTRFSDGKSEGLNRSHMSKRSASGAQLAHALSASVCFLADWRPTA